MDKEETKAALKDVISNLIKDDPEAARQGLHDVLANKMRDRVNPQVEAAPEEGLPGDGEIEDEDGSAEGDDGGEPAGE